MSNNNYKGPTLLWHDYEAWGANPQRDHPSQFAAIRTDYELNPIAEPINWMCQIPSDYLPHPMACIITGITPQKSLQKGFIEAEFMAKVHAELSAPNTCVVGYNNIRYDDELTRFSLYRNFFDPYAREWQNNNSRWDIIDLLRATYALRPDGILWPERENGDPSFKLEELAKSNDLEHTSAHDALSDVEATIGLAKLIKSQQPKLYDFYFQHRSKNKVLQTLQLGSGKPLVHVSSRFPAVNGCCTLVQPLAIQNGNKNGIIAVNLNGDINGLIELPAEDIKRLLYTKSSEMEEHELRPPIKVIHINKCPFVAPLNTLTADNADRLNLPLEQMIQNNQKVLQHQTEIIEKLQWVFASDERPGNDPDYDLYGGGFITDADKRVCQRVHEVDPISLDSLSEQFSEQRLKTLLFRYRARNYPHTLSHDEMNRWQHHRYEKLHESTVPASIKLPEYFMEIERLTQEFELDPRKMGILKQLYLFAEQL